MNVKTGIDKLLIVLTGSRNDKIQTKILYINLGFFMLVIITYQLESII